MPGPRTLACSRNSGGGSNRSTRWSSSRSCSSSASLCTSLALSAISHSPTKMSARRDLGIRRAVRRNRNVGGSGLTSWSPGATLVARIGVRGNDLLRNPILNRGTAFTDAERQPSTAGAKALAAVLRRRVDGEVRFDRGSRALYATDGSDDRRVPIGVVVPRHAGDVL